MKKRLFFLPMVAIMMAACSSNDTIEVNENKGDLISFRPIVKGVTRAADVNTDNLASFVVNAKQSGGSISYFDNGVFNKSGSVFVSESKYYWPASGPLDFYAYSPSGNAQVNYSGYKTFTVTPSTTIADQVDFVFAATMNKSKEDYGASGVPLNFRHTGAKIACNVKNSSTTLKFDVCGWKVGYICPAATFTFTDANTDGNNDGSGTTLTLPQWGSRTAASIGTEYESTFSVNQIGQSGATSLDGQMILIPQAITAASGYASASAGANLNGTYIAVKLKIRNNDSAGTIIADDGAGNAFWAIWPIGGYNWEPGKKYTYTIDLAGGGAKYYPEALADLKARIGIEDCSGYVGKYVDKNGYITNNKTGSIGTIAHIKTDGDVDKSYAGSRIIVLSTNIVGNAPWDNCGTANPISLEETYGIYSGYAKTKHLYDTNPSQYLAAKAAWEYQSKNGNAVITGSSGWFLPDGKQATDIYSNRYRNGLNLLDDDIFWASDEYGPNDALGWSKSGTQWCSSRTTSNKIYPCFVY